MKNLLPILLAVVVLSSGCNPDPDGYSCNSEGCYEDNNSQYLTLDDCIDDCFSNCGEIEHQGYSYNTIQIGNQCWFRENCRYLPEVSHPNSFSDSGPPLFTPTHVPHCYVYGYEGTDVAAAQATENYATYGVLYNWNAAMTYNICPSGWHLPSLEDFYELTDFLVGDPNANNFTTLAGGKMKEAGDDHWMNGNGSGSDNSSGWTGLPGASFIPYLDMNTSSNIGWSGSWWTNNEGSTGGNGGSTGGNGTNAFAFSLFTTSSTQLQGRARNEGCSCRCIQD